MICLLPSTDNYIQGFFIFGDPAGQVIARHAAAWVEPTPVGQELLHLGMRILLSRVVAQEVPTLGMVLQIDASRTKQVIVDTLPTSGSRHKGAAVLRRRFSSVLGAPRAVARRLAYALEKTHAARRHGVDVRLVRLEMSVAGKIIPAQLVAHDAPDRLPGL